MKDTFEASLLISEDENELDDQAHQQRPSRFTFAERLVLPWDLRLSNCFNEWCSRVLKGSMSATILKGMSVRI